MHIFFNFFSHSSLHIPLPLRFTSPAAAPHPYRIPPEKFHKYDKKTTQI